LTLHEGKQHEVKRLLEAVGHPVSKLKRVSFGPVTTKGLEPGQFRALTPEEVAGLLRGEATPETRAWRPRRPPRPTAPRRRGTDRWGPPRRTGTYGDGDARVWRRRGVQGQDRPAGAQRRDHPGKGGRRRPGTTGPPARGRGRGGQR
jgi:hypothetical protein